MSNELRSMVTRCKAGFPCGITSYCTADELVIEACLQQALRLQDIVLIEATANQVNQFGGYTGKRPSDFRDVVYRIADNTGFPRERIILGGDHLGPLVWQNEPEAAAMEKAARLVREYVLAGFTKIHLDTSMRLGDDSREFPLSDETIARRGAWLCRASEEAFRQLSSEGPDRQRPVYIIGSEVPIPGGARESEDTITVTEPLALEHTLTAYRNAFVSEGLSAAFENIIGVVVQPGVEFGDTNFFRYDRSRARTLTAMASKLPGIVLEGHSTDYQPAASLREMIEDGIAILKVGPALTFALRESLFALSYIENQLVPEEKRAHFIETLEDQMLKTPGNWNRHYHGDERQLFIKRKYSFSDRCRYYFALPEIKACIEKLFLNLDFEDIPLGVLRQFMPLQYYKVRDGVLPLKARELAKDGVAEMIEDYNYATRHHYTVRRF